MQAGPIVGRGAQCGDVRVATQFGRQLRQHLADRLALMAQAHAFGGHLSRAAGEADFLFARHHVGDRARQRGGGREQIDLEHQHRVALMIEHMRERRVRDDAAVPPEFAVDLDRRQAGRRLDLHLDRRAQRRQHLAQAGQQLAHVELLGAQLLAAGKGQQPASDRFAAPGGVLDRLLDREGLLEQLVAEDGIIDRLGALMETIVRIGPVLEGLAPVVGGVHEAASGIHDAVTGIDKSAAGLDDSARALVELLGPVVDIVERLPGAKRRAAVRNRPAGRGTDAAEGAGADNLTP